MNCVIVAFPIVGSSLNFSVLLTSEVDMEMMHLP